jgi:hypothetical protein
MFDDNVIAAGIVEFYFNITASHVFVFLFVVLFLLFEFVFPVSCSQPQGCKSSNNALVSEVSHLASARQRKLLARKIRLS